MANKTLPLVLVADDDGAHRLMLRTLLKDWGYAVEEAPDGRMAVDFVRLRPVDLILMDMRMPVLDGLEATRQIHQFNPAIPIIIITAYSSIPTAVEALKSGAFDYLTKPLDFDAARVVIDRALKHVRLEQENEGLRQQLARLQVSRLVGNSPSMQGLLEMVALVAPTEATVLITGESGTGKGLVARALHANSGRREKPLIEVNCAAIPENLMESELFGHERGAFTGADRRRSGRFALADGGTIFLDEVGDLPLLMQVKLLRVLQEGDIQRVGSDSAIPVDVRVVAATNRDLEQMVKDGTFREDLYYRLNVVRINVPPLYERKEDIPLLAEYFRQRFAEKNRKTVRGITPRAMDLLVKHMWPGNVRELENAMERAIILVQGDYISERELPAPIRELAAEYGGEELGEKEPFALNADWTLAEVEKQMIMKMLEETGGNKSEAARRLGITRRTLKLKLKKYEEQGQR
ncbi:sigma-54-dependent transcriptional regulator [Desulfoferrobacter suflitae]|uniref:sigma-54-dependent transcriptional regulator n=1 Tax=Desulfoferrobacter suflitae TaxID=2865782 RepID=UPI002164AC0A|nr:sigma-54 dependent transcriptional regulator [Desulfoferrobacter suflitae]MCK8602864.1 sigma-54 dependent transcriptional regulator [Desulfoferrobacter suflitae]